MVPSKNPSTTVEKSDLESSQPTPQNEVVEDFTPPVSTSSSFGTLLKGLTTAGVEMRGLEPIPPEKRNHTKYYNIFTLFGGSFVSVLP
jgi:hypothetical protein